MSNRLTISAYDSSGTLRVNTGLEHAQDVTYTTIYPGGLFGEAQFLIRCDPTRGFPLSLNDRIVIHNGLKTVWEGYLTTLSLSADEVEQGYQCTCLGAWGNFLMQRKTIKPWADTRLESGVWIYATAWSGAEICTLDLQNRLRFTPKHEAWANNTGATAYYYAPAGETIKRITFNYDMQEGGQAWLLGCDAPAGSLWSVTSSGTGTQDITLGTPGAWVRFTFFAQGDETPPSDGTVYGQATSVVVYTETGNINPFEIVKDVAAKVSELSTDYSLVGASTDALVPFIAEQSGESYADLLIRLVSYGDASNNAWAVGVRESDLASDGKPIIFLEQQPALTATDYCIRVDEPNLVPPFEAEQDISTVANWIDVAYQDAAGKTQHTQPADDAAAKDDASITAYGQREQWLSLDTTNVSDAQRYSHRLLAQTKTPRWICSNGITVSGYIRSASGGLVPAAEIRAGMRVRVENFLNDLSGTGLTFLITATNYNDADQTNQLSVGMPSPLDTWLARMERALEINRGY